MSDTVPPRDPSDPMAAFDAAQARLEGMLADARANSTRSAELADEARTAFATVASARDEVTVTARLGGGITAIRFHAAALELGATELERLTVETIAKAQHAASLRFAEAAAARFGADSPLATSLRADAEAAFPSPPGTLK